MGRFQPLLNSDSADIAPAPAKIPFRDFLRVEETFWEELELVLRVVFMADFVSALDRTVNQ